MSENLSAGGLELPKIERVPEYGLTLCTIEGYIQAFWDTEYSDEKCIEITRAILDEVKKEHQLWHTLHQ